MPKLHKEQINKIANIPVSHLSNYLEVEVKCIAVHRSISVFAY